MPEIETPESETNRSLLLRMLYDEQTRLRAEVEALRQQKNEKGGDDQEGGDDKKQGGDQKDKEKDNKGSDPKDDQKDGDQQDGDKKEEAKKPPLKDRARGWVKDHPIGTVLIVIGLVVLLIAGIILWRYLTSYETTDDAFVDGHTDPISPRISGFVVRVNVEDTYRVKKGDVLVELDARDYQTAKERAFANYNESVANMRAQEPNVPVTQTTQTTQLVEANLNVVGAQANVAAAEERFRSAQADLRQAEANAANAAREEERYRILVEKEEVSREVYDQHATEARAQEAVVASRRETAEAAQKQVTTTNAQLGQARQQAKQAQLNTPRQIAIQRQTLEQRRADAQAALAQANQAQLNLEYTKIYAPEDGIIGDKSVQVATQVQAGQEMFALTQTNDIWITANFKETEIKQMWPGEKVTIYVDALSQKFNGYVEALPGASGAVYSLLPPENATGNYVKVVQRLPVRIRFYPNQPNEDRLAPGMSVEPKVWVR